MSLVKRRLNYTLLFPLIPQPSVADHIHHFHSPFFSLLHYKGSTINTAHSTTLEEVGITNYLISETHPWQNIRGTIIAEKDPAKQGELRRKLGTTVDYFLTSMTAVTETGEIAHGDQTGTKVGGVAYGAGNVIVVAGTNKIVKDEAEAFTRTKDFCLPFVSAYSRRAFKIKEAFMTNYEVLRATQNGRIQVVLVKDVLGF